MIVHAAPGVITRELRSVAVWGALTEAPLSLPSDIAAGPGGSYFVVDGGNDRVVKFDGNGSLVHAFGSHGAGDGQLDGPVGIGVGPSGNVFVADRGNHRLQVFSADGDFLRSLPLVADGVDVVPVDVAVSSGDELFVTAANLHSVLVYSLQGVLLRQWGSRGKAPGQFFHPATVALAGDTLYVVDVLNARVQAFDTSGAAVATFGRLGAGPGTFFRPKGVAVDDAGRVYVSDSYFGVIQVFSGAGEFLHALGHDDTARQFDHPVGMSAGGERLHIVQMRSGSVQVLDLGGAH